MFHTVYFHLYTRKLNCRYGILPAMASDFYNNSVFWIEVNRIQPNPYQPRKEFDQEALQSLSDSIRQYGILQPLVVTRREIERGDGGISVEYELVAGERRLRASKLAGISQVPVLIRNTEDSDKVKLELAIIENLQREDLNPIDRALAFKQLADTFNLKHVEIAKKVGRSREYVSNSLRILALSEEMQQAVVARYITEGHTRPLLMLIERPDEQAALFKEITEKKLTVREAERIARGIATDRARKQDLSPELAALERELTERLGTRVQIETRDQGGKLHIDFFTPTDVEQFLALVSSVAAPLEVNKISAEAEEKAQEIERILSPLSQFTANASGGNICQSMENEMIVNDVPEEEISQEREEDEDIYSISKFSV